jgi:hypothetical protein
MSKVKVSHTIQPESSSKFQPLLTRLFTELTGGPITVKCLHSAPANDEKKQQILLVSGDGHELLVSIGRETIKNILNLNSSDHRLIDLVVADRLKRITRERLYLKSPDHRRLESALVNYSIGTQTNEIIICQIAASNEIDLELVESLVSGAEISLKRLPPPRERLPLRVVLSYDQLADMAAQLQSQRRAYLSDLSLSVELLSSSWLSCSFEQERLNKVICRIGDIMEKRGVTITLGAIDMSAEDLLGLQPGSTIEIEKPQELNGLIQIDGTTWAEVTVNFDNDRMILTATKVVDAEVDL